MMASVDVFLQNRRSSRSIRRALAAVLSVAPDQVSMIRDIAEYPKQKHAAVCRVRNFTSGFRQLITIDWPSNFPETELPKALCHRLRVVCLVPANCFDPFVMEMLHPNGSTQIVSIDPSELEKHGTYVIQDTRKGN